MAKQQECQGGKRYRTCLPAEQVVEESFNMWSVLKGGIGKELTKVPMPVVFNEPLSFLQRMAEFMEYSELLEKAALQEDSISRMQYVAAFAVSGLASNSERIGKPFNPLLGETYELQRDGFRMVCEQVSHHPPVSAFHAEGDKFLFRGSVQPRLKFWGRSLEISPRGTLMVELPGYEEQYTWNIVNSYVHNVVVGKVWIEQQGTMHITNHRTGDTCTINFKPVGCSSKDPHRVEGHIIDAMKARRLFLYGKWTSHIRSTDMESYEAYAAVHDHKLGPGSEPERRAGLSPIHGTKKMFSKLNSITSSPFRNHSERESVDTEPPPEEPTTPEGRLSRSGSDHSLDIAASETLWQAEPRPADSHKYYHFTRFAMSLNQLEEGAEICCTDSRLRPDIRALENGDTDRAASEKARLEEKQRLACKARTKRKLTWKPLYFQSSTGPDSKVEDWVYMNNYWSNKSMSNLDIF